MNCPKCGKPAVYRRRVTLETTVDVDYPEINPDHIKIHHMTMAAVDAQARAQTPYWPFVIKHQASLGCRCSDPNCDTVISPPDSSLR